MNNKKLDFDKVFDFANNFGADFINLNKELIIDEKTNTYAPLAECVDIEDVEMITVFCLCRPIYKGLSDKKSKLLMRRVNDYFGVNLNKKDFGVMYRELCYRHKFDEFKKFIKNGFPIKDLELND